MKGKGSAFFTLVACLVICALSIISMIYGAKSAKINDEKHIYYKNLETKVEYTDGSNIDMNCKTGALSKKISISNIGEDNVYIDLIWNSVDGSFESNDFEYYITGSSINSSSFPANKNANVPLSTTEGILMGELIAPGDTVIYEMNITPSDFCEEYEKLNASMGVNIRYK